MTSHPGFFGGSSVHGGRVRRLKADNFEQLVQNYINVPVVIQMTRADFLADPDRDAKKDGAFLCPAAFPFDEGHRCDANASHCVLCVLDLDEGNFVRDFFESPESVAEALHPLAFAMWTTAKHTPEAPRLKIVVPVKPCDPTLHKRAVHHLIDRLGLPQAFKGLRESRTLTLPAYRPVQFLDEEFNAVVMTRTQAQEIDPTKLPEGDDEDAERVYAMNGDEAASIAFLPVAGLKVEDIREPLEKIDPDCPYAQWVAIACALRHQFQQDEDASREAYQLFDEWSSKGSKYKGEPETYGKWKSFKPYAKGRQPITIRSLFKMAMDAGWQNTKVAASIKDGFHDWLRQCDDHNHIMLEAPKRIAQMPFVNEIIEETLIMAMRDRLRELKGINVDKTTLRKVVSSARFIERNEQAAASGDMEQWLRPFTFIGPDNIFYNLSNGVIFSVDGFNNAFSRYLLPTDGGDKVQSGRPSVLPAHHALNVRQIKVVDGAVYDPRYVSEHEPFFSKDGKSYVNKYRASSVPREERNYMKKAGGLYYELMEALIGEDQYIQHLTDYFAHIVQKPGFKIRHCPIIQGAQGCGKGTIVDVVTAALGHTNVKIVSPGGMNSDFCDWAEGAVLVLFDEVRAPGKNRHEIMNRIKAAITNDVISLNQKFRDVRVIENISNYIALTNFRDAIHLEETDRRFFVIFSPIVTKDQVLALTDTGIFERIHRLKADHPGAFRSFFLEHTISDSFKPDKDAPPTRFRDMLIANSKSAVAREIEELIETSDNPRICNEVVDMNCMNFRSLDDRNQHAYALRDRGMIAVGGHYWVDQGFFSNDQMNVKFIDNYLETKEFLLSEV